METRVLYNGVEMPAVGFGCYNLKDGRETILSAIRAGYRLFDTASYYLTEEPLGQAIRDSGVPREKLFLTSKLWKTQMDHPQRAFEDTLRALGTDYLDLYLIHWPRPDLKDKYWRDLDLKVWHCLEGLYKKGAVRAIGVSNFLPHHLMNLLEHCTVRPMVDQLEHHPGYSQETAVKYCQAQDIQVEGWAPLGRMRLSEDVQLQEMAWRYHVTVPQICLRFAVQMGVIPLPKSSSPERMEENLNIFGFTLSEEDLYCLRTMPPVAWLGEHPDRERTVTN